MEVSSLGSGHKVEAFNYVFGDEREEEKIKINGEESRKKEKDAEIQICTAIKELRSKDDGKRDNSIILQHVHDFYTKRK